MLRRGWPFLLLLLMAAIGGGWYVATTSRAVTVPQPIRFNHQIHAAKKIKCSYCHKYAASLAAAGLPRIQVCISCHKAVKTRTPEIEKIFAFWEKGEEVPWVRLYELPQFTLFSHKRHVRAGVECETCHGTMAELTEPVRLVTHTMGACLTCHEQHNASTDCLTCHR